MEKSWPIWLTVADFYPRLEDYVRDEFDWKEVTKEEKAQIRKILENDIAERLNQKNFIRSLKKFLMEFYEQDGMGDDFAIILDKVIGAVEKRIRAESEEKDKELRADVEARERAEYERLKKKFETRRK